MNRPTLAALATFLAAAPSGAERLDEVTFTGDVAPIFVERCMTCHRPGEIAPMSLLSYEEARPWAGSFAVVTRHHAFGFTNGDAFRDELEGMVGQQVEITGFLRVDRIEIQKIEIRSPR